MSYLREASQEGKKHGIVRFTSCDIKARFTAGTWNPEIPIWHFNPILWQEFRVLYFPDGESK
jgi:hypothetical protein